MARSSSVISITSFRQKKAKRRSGQSALVRDFLIQMAREEDTHDRLKALQKKTLKEITKFRAGDRLSRAEAHNR
jgi:hypothetical protein